MNRLLKLVLTLVIAVSCVLSSVGVSALPNVKQLPQSENLQDTSPTSYPPSGQSGNWTNPTNAYASNNTYATRLPILTSSLNPAATTNGTSHWLTASSAYSSDNVYATATYNIPTFRAAGTVATGNSTSLAIGQPTGTTSGDVLLCFLIDHSTTNANSAAPIGWHAIGYAYVSGIRFQLFSAVSGKNGLTGTSWTFGTTLTARCQGVILGFYGCDNSGYGGIDTPTFRQNASGTTGTTSITTTAINEMVIGAFASSANGATWSSETTGTMGTLIGTEWVDSAYSTYSSIAVAGKIWTSSGSTGASSATMSANTTNCGILLALKPASTMIQFISTGAATNGTTGSISPALPAGLVPNDVCVLVASTIAGGSITKNSDGSIAWSAVSGSPIDVTSGEKLYVWWGRYETGSTAPTLTPASDHSIGQIFAYRGVDTNSAIDVQATGTQTSTSTTFSFATGLTTGTNNDKVIVVCSSGYDTATAQFTNAWTNANLTDISDKTIIDSQTSSGGGGGFGVSDGNLATAGAVGTWATTLVTTSTQAYICFAFKPSTNYNATNLDQIYGTFGITGSTTITKVEVGYEAFATATQTMDIYTSANGGGAWSAAHNTGNLGTSDPDSYTYINVTEDQTWTWTLLNDTNFKLKVITHWVNGVPTWALDALVVRVTYSDSSNLTQNYTTYGISLTGDIVTKVEVGVEAYAASSEKVSLAVSSNGGSSWSSTQTSSALSGSDPNSTTWFDFTSAYSWTPTLLNNTNFQVQITWVTNGSYGTVYLDYIPVRVTYVIPPVGVSATDGTYTDKVTVTWTKSSGANAYKVLRGATNDSGTLGDVATYDDTAAGAPTITAGAADATDGASTSYVTCTLSGNSGNSGSTESYTVYASTDGGTTWTGASSGDNGNRGTTTLTFQWQMSDADSDAAYNTNLTSGTTNPFNATTGVPAPSITAGAASASDGTSTSYVTLSLSGQTGNAGAKRYFRCAVSMTGATTQYSTGNEGYIGTTTLTYQWQRSASDSDASYSDIGSATTNPYNDTAAPAGGAKRYFRCTVSMTGASNQNSTADEGWEATGSVSNTPDSSNLGYLFPSTTYYASGSAPSNPVVVGNCPFTITNCGTAPINLMIRCSDWTGGNTWIIVSGTPTGDQIKMVAYYEGENPASGLVLSNSDQDFYDNLAVGSPIAWLTLQDSGGSYKTLESSGDVAVLTLMADVGAELNWGFSILTGGTDGIFSDTVTKTGTITITAY
jgi:hypothetical protein